MWEIYNNKHITYFLHILYIYSEVYIIKIRVPFYYHGDCENDWENKGVGWSSCAKINFKILIDAQVDQATYIVNLTND